MFVKIEDLSGNTHYLNREFIIWIERCNGGGHNIKLLTGAHYQTFMISEEEFTGLIAKLRLA